MRLAILAGLAFVAGCVTQIAGVVGLRRQFLSYGN
jgi:hypothetical protein